VLLRDIPFQSHCEHHMAPIIGKARSPTAAKRVSGISKLARVLHGFRARLQVQERLTAQVADCIWEHLSPRAWRW
jgi:GTP cyclohydrolase I